MQLATKLYVYCREKKSETDCKLQKLRDQVKEQELS